MDLVLPFSIGVKESADNAIAFAEQLFKQSKGYLAIPVRVSIKGIPDVCIVVHHDTDVDEAAEDFITALYDARSDPLIARRQAYREYEQALTAYNADFSNSALSAATFLARDKLKSLI
jgi:hypothetical protein